MPHTFDARHEARRVALSTIFSWSFMSSKNEDPKSLALEGLEVSDFDTELANSIIEGVENNIDQIDKVIMQSAPEWPIDKISKIDLVVLRIAIFEIVFGKSVPEKVAIDEAVELAKEFGNDTSSKFVNGVLGSVVSTKSESITINSLI